MFRNNEKKLKIKQLESENDQLLSTLSAIIDNVAYIEFTPSGHIIKVNQHFLDVVNYQEQDVIGQHHSIFCESTYVNSPEYKRFWQLLNDGKPHKGEFPRIDSQGKKIWLDATYFPVIKNNTIEKIIKIANDITEQYEIRLSQEAIANALDRALAIIEFTPDGTILSANQNFLNTMGYQINEIINQHHKMFCDNEFYQNNPDFWKELQKGKFKNGQFSRTDAFGKTVWLEATYNPIFDNSGKVIKVIKFASNITKRIEHNDAISQAANAAHSTALSTLDTATKGTMLLQNSIEKSDGIITQVQNSVETIKKLNEQSVLIGSIVSTINSIANQTNLLALNAAIEAARAGEFGRGFAVVADEVRKLALETTHSTSEIAEVVTNNQTLTEEITQQIESVSETALSSRSLLTDVASSITEIEQGSHQVTNTISELTNKNALN